MSMKPIRRPFHHSTKRATVAVRGQPTVETPLGTLSSILQQFGLKGSIVKYLVIIEKGPRSFGAHVPDLPGCIAVAKTRAQVLKLIKSAIEFHIEGLKEAGKKVPRPHSEARVVVVSAA